MAGNGEAKRDRTAARARAQRIRTALAVVATAAVVLAGVISWALTRPDDGGSDGDNQAHVAAWDAQWDPLPGRGTSPRSMQTVRDAYAFAANREEIVQYLPCYCGCEREGHRSLRDCFIKGRAADGTPEWEPMGYT